jgi:hypothetical protein
MSVNKNGGAPYKKTEEVDSKNFQAQLIGPFVVFEYDNKTNKVKTYTKYDNYTDIPMDVEFFQTRTIDSERDNLMKNATPKTGGSRIYRRSRRKRTYKRKNKVYRKSKTLRR